MLPFFQPKRDAVQVSPLFNAYKEREPAKPTVNKAVLLSAIAACGFVLYNMVRKKTFVIDRNCNQRAFSKRFADGLQIKIPIKIRNNSQTFSITVTYSSSITIQNILDQIINTINNKLPPKTYNIYRIHSSFIKKAYRIHKSLNHAIWNKSITDFEAYDIVTKGIEISIINNNQYDYNTKCIVIPIKVKHHNITSFSIKITYSSTTTIKHILDETINSINNKLPKTYNIHTVYSGLFIKKTFHIHNSIYSLNKAFWKKSITDFEPHDIINNDLVISIIDREKYDYNTTYIVIPIHIQHSTVRLPFSLKIQYISSMTIQKVLNYSIHHINDKKFNTEDTRTKKRIYSIHQVKNGSFTGNINNLGNSSSIIKYLPCDIVNKGLIISVKNLYTHKVQNNHITCKYIKNNKVKSLKCPIYQSMMNKNEFTEKNLNHLFECEHFKDEYNDKPECDFGYQCPSFIELSNGGNKLPDRCHIKLYNHPPRSNRQINLTENIHSFIVNTDNKQNKEIYKPKIDDDEKSNATSFTSKFMSLLYKPQDDDIKKYKYNDKDGWINALIEEVINNGYKYDLCKSCTKKNEKQSKFSLNSLYSFFTPNTDINCKHDVYKNNSNTLLLTVDAKLKHIRHIQIGSPLRRDHMLSLLLYSGCDCNYNLCSTQRNGDYLTWKWFDHCLYEAIKLLSFKETGKYKLYSGLGNVKLDKKQIKNGYFTTYVSSSWQKGVAMTFIKSNGSGKGMMIAIDENYRSKTDVICCDISWISKFPDECEVLIARSSKGRNNFSLSLKDEQDGIQSISLK